MKFHTVMAEPFVEKADQIQNVFSQTENVKQSEQLGQIDPPLKEKISYIRNTCPKKIKNAINTESGIPIYCY